MTEAFVTGLRRIALVVEDAEGLERFFQEAFGFEALERGVEDAGWAKLLGVPDATVRQSVLRLGGEEIALLAFDPPGRAYPAASTATDAWFQHFAIIVSDMAAAYDRLSRTGRFSPISEGGPQTLPPRSGSVSAFKFRDIEGHPLELLAFPPDHQPPFWRSRATGALCLGIDHSAIVVADTRRSLAFYRDSLGLQLAEQTENQGAEQSRLDAAPQASVTVTGLKPRRVATPHVELLGYHVGSRRPIPEETTSRDIAASVLVLETDALADLVEVLTQSGTRFISPGIVALASGEEAVAVLDPDGHRLVIMQRRSRAA